jgi:hypothetical protein
VILVDWIAVGTDGGRVASAVVGPFAVMTRLAAGAKPTRSELTDVAAMWLDVIGNGCGRRSTLCKALLAHGLLLQLVLSARAILRVIVPLAPMSVVQRCHLVDLLLLITRGRTVEAQRLKLTVVRLVDLLRDDVILLREAALAQTIPMEIASRAQKLLC